MILESKVASSTPVIGISAGSPSAKTSKSEAVRTVSGC